MPGFNAMMKMKSILIAIAAASLTLSSTAFAQTAQMTGKVIAVTSDKITVQNGKEVWDINLTASTKVSGDKKVGSTVTVTYNAPDAQKKAISLSALAFIAGAVLPSPAKLIAYPCELGQTAKSAVTQKS
jgi:hypothetical protein